MGNHTRQLPRPLAKMLNADGKVVDLYIPRKCSATNMLITAKDHSSVQINIGKLDETGRYSGDYNTFAFCGFIREKGESNMFIDGIWEDIKAGKLLATCLA